MAKTKIQVVESHAVEDIRAGVDDAALMEKYGLSSRGLESLFKKLVMRGKLAQSDLDRRIFSSMRSHVVELVEYPEPKVAKPIVNAAGAVRDILSGVSDARMMEKYNISVKGLESLFRKLVAAGEITQAEIDKRELNDPWREPEFEPVREFADEDLREEPIETPSRPSRFGRIVQDYKVYLAAAVGALAGMAFVLIVLLMVNGLGPLSRQESAKAVSHFEIAAEALQKQAEELIAVLEDIVRREGVIEPSGETPGGSQASEYQRCIQDCEMSHLGADASNKVFLVNCRRECLAMYSERFRKIREKYH